MCFFKGVNRKRPPHDRPTKSALPRKGEAKVNSQSGSASEILSKGSFDPSKGKTKEKDSEDQTKDTDNTDSTGQLSEHTTRSPSQRTDQVVEVEKILQQQHSRPAVPAVPAKKFPVPRKKTSNNDSVHIKSKLGCVDFGNNSLLESKNSVMFTVMTEQFENACVPTCIDLKKALAGPTSTSHQEIDEDDTLAFVCPKIPSIVFPPLKVPPEAEVKRKEARKPRPKKRSSDTSEDSTQTQDDEG